MHEVSEEDINVIIQPIALFIQPGKIDYKELTNAKTTPAKNHGYSSDFLPLGIQPSSLHLILTDNLVATDKPPPCPRFEAVYTACLARKAYLPEFRFWGAWVHPNPGNHLYVGITEDSKWQARWEKILSD